MVNYNEIKEPWNYYELEDGSKVKLKTILVSIFDEGHESADELGYWLKNDYVVGVEPSKETLGNESLTPIEDIKCNTISENWSEYSLDDGRTVMIKSVITQINRTGELDDKKIPIYTVTLSPVITIK